MSLALVALGKNIKIVMVNYSSERKNMARITVCILFFILSACAREVVHQGCYVADPYLRGTYVGGCQNNMAHGRGKAVGKDSYEGDFVKGVLHGHGTYFWHDGDRFVGQFRNGYIHGNGVLIKKEGNRQAGRWENNQWVGETY